MTLPMKMDTPQSALQTKAPGGDSLDQTVRVFHCSQCGDCCSSWNLPIEWPKAEYLLAQPWVQARLQETNTNIDRVSRKFGRLPLTPSQLCVFLAEDRRCMIHAQEGPEWKPDECKRFPFATAHHADGRITYDVSASCKTVTENLLAEFLPVVPQPDSSLPEVFPDQYDVIPQKIQKSSGWFSNKLSWDGYFLYREQLKTVFQQPEIPTLVALKQAQQVWAALPGEGRPLINPFSVNPGWYYWVPFLFLRKIYSTASMGRMLFEKQYLDPKVLGPEEIPFEAPNFAWAEGVSSPCLNGYLYNILRRQALLAYGHSLEGILSLATVGYFLVCWYAWTLARGVGKPKPDEIDLTLAIRLVERYYTGHQPVFVDNFRGIPPLASLHRLLLGQP